MAHSIGSTHSHARRRPVGPDSPGDVPAKNRNQELPEEKRDGSSIDHRLPILLGARPCMCCIVCGTSTGRDRFVTTTGLPDTTTRPPFAVNHGAVNAIRLRPWVENVHTQAPDDRGDLDVECGNGSEPDEIALVLSPVRPSTSALAVSGWR
jgi:hypothetical protein